MINLGEFLLLLVYLAVVLWIAKVAGRISPYYWAAAFGVAVLYGVLGWQEADVERRIAAADQQRYAEVRK